MCVHEEELDRMKECASADSAERPGNGVDNIPTTQGQV